MNKKGFTLLEMIAVVGIIGLLSIIVSRPILSLFKQSEETADDIVIQNIVSSSKLWLNDNLPSLSNSSDDTITVSVKTLKEEGYLDEKLIKPSSNELIDENDCVVINKIGINNYNYEYKTSAECLNN